MANTAFGWTSFLVLEAIGGFLLINYGFTNAVWPITVVTLIIFTISFPISCYAARYNIDIDLLTRSTGFGYIGSTVTSLIYASFTFILFALEASYYVAAYRAVFPHSYPHSPHYQCVDHHSARHVWNFHHHNMTGLASTLNPGFFGA